MTDIETRIHAGGRIVLGGIGLLLTALILLWPGPIDLRDSVAFALLFAIPSVVLLSQARTLLQRAS